DLSAVRLHAGSDAAEAARSVQARAFTVGRDIAFAAGELDPESAGGKRLLAHELVHTVQQGATAGGTLRRDPDPDGEPASGATPEPAHEPTAAELREIRQAEIRASRSSPGGLRVTLQPFRVT